MYRAVLLHKDGTSSTIMLEELPGSLEFVAHKATMTCVERLSVMAANPPIRTYRRTGDVGTMPAYEEQP